MQHISPVVDVLLATVLAGFVVWFYYTRSMYLCIKAVRPEFRVATPWWVLGLWIPFVGGFMQLFIVWVVSKGFEREAKGKGIAPPPRELALIGYVAGLISIPMFFMRGIPALGLSLMYMVTWILWWVRSVRYRKSLSGPQPGRAASVSPGSGDKG